MMVIISEAVSVFTYNLNRNFASQYLQLSACLLRLIDLLILPKLTLRLFSFISLNKLMF